VHVVHVHDPERATDRCAIRGEPRGSAIEDAEIGGLLHVEDREAAAVERRAHGGADDAGARDHRFAVGVWHHAIDQPADPELARLSLDPGEQGSCGRRHSRAGVGRGAHQDTAGVEHGPVARDPHRAQPGVAAPQDAIVVVLPEHRGLRLATGCRRDREARARSAAVGGDDRAVHVERGGRPGLLEPGDEEVAAGCGADRAVGGAGQRRDRRHGLHGAVRSDPREVHGAELPPADQVALTVPAEERIAAAPRAGDGRRRAERPAVRVDAADVDLLVGVPPIIAPRHQALAVRAGDRARLALLGRAAEELDAVGIERAAGGEPGAAALPEDQCGVAAGGEPERRRRRARGRDPDRVGHHALGVDPARPGHLGVEPVDAIEPADDERAAAPAHRRLVLLAAGRRRADGEGRAQRREPRREAEAHDVLLGGAGRPGQEVDAAGASGDPRRSRAAIDERDAVVEGTALGADACAANVVEVAPHDEEVVAIPCDGGIGAAAQVHGLRIHHATARRDPLQPDVVAVGPGDQEVVGAERDRGREVRAPLLEDDRLLVERAQLRIEAVPLQTVRAVVRDAGDRAVAGERAAQGCARAAAQDEPRQRVGHAVAAHAYHAAGLGKGDPTGAGPRDGVGPRVRHRHQVATVDLDLVGERRLRGRRGHRHARGDCGIGAGEVGVVVAAGEGADGRDGGEAERAGAHLRREGQLCAPTSRWVP
jgi:hypothetical protein